MGGHRNLISSIGTRAVVMTTATEPAPSQTRASAILEAETRGSAEVPVPVAYWPPTDTDSLLAMPDSHHSPRLRQAGGSGGVVVDVLQTISTSQGPR